MSGKNFLRGAMILTIAGLLVKVIGAGNRIFLSRLLGGEGIGLYQMAYPIYQTALSISTAGIPVAISVFVAEKMAHHDLHGAKRIFHISLAIMAGMGLLFSGLLYLGAGWLIKMEIVRDERAYYAIIALAPAIFFVTVLASYRGYFQGLQQMTPTAVSQVMEQLIRVVTMLILVVVLLPYGLAYGAAGASFGAVTGSIAGVAVLFIWYRREKLVSIELPSQVNQESSLRIVKQIIKLALPVSLANLMLPLTANIDLFVVPVRLEHAGYSVAEATELFGYLTGMAGALVNLPTILTASLAASLVPAVSESFAMKDHHSIVERSKTAFRFANMMMIPSFVGLFLLARPISELLYATPNAGYCIEILSIGVVMLGMGQVSTGILQGLGHTVIPFVNMVIAGCVKLVLSYILTGMPELGIRGAAWATNADFGVAAGLNLIYLYRYVGNTIAWKSTSKVILSSILMGIGVYFTYGWLMKVFLHNNWATLGTIGVGMIIYIVSLLATGGIQVWEISALGRLKRKMR